MLSVGHCGVARIQMKSGHMDGMHCIIDGTSILVKIKSVALYNCQTVYYALWHLSTHTLPSCVLLMILWVLWFVVLETSRSRNFLLCTEPEGTVAYSYWTLLQVSTVWSLLYFFKIQLYITLWPVTSLLLSLQTIVLQSAQLVFLK